MYLPRSIWLGGVCFASGLCAYRSEVTEIDARVTVLCLMGPVLNGFNGEPVFKGGTVKCIEGKTE